MSFHRLVCLQESPKTFLNPVRILVLPPNHGGGRDFKKHKRARAGGVLRQQHEQRH